MYEASIQCWFYIDPPAKRADCGVKIGPPPLTPRMNAYQKSLETVFSIAICRHCGDKLEFKTLLPTIFIYVRRSC